MTAAEARILEEGRLVAAHPVLEGRGQRRIAEGHRRLPPPANSTTPRQPKSVPPRRGDMVNPRPLAVYEAIGRRLASREAGS